MSILTDSAGDGTVDLTSLQVVHRIDLHPYDAYLSRLSGTSKRTMQGCLDMLASLITGRTNSDDGTKITGRDIAWWEFTYAHAVVLRAMITTRGWSPANINKHLSAYRQVIKEAWRIGLMPAERHARATDIPNETGTRLPAGRHVEDDERAALLAACDDGTPKGARDGAIVAVLYATGIRRDELVKLDLADWASRPRQLRIRGKRDKERLVPVAEDAAPWLERWLRIRGNQPGSLFCPTPKGGRVIIRRLTGQTIRDVLGVRCRQSALDQASPHDFRRTVVGDLLDAGVDLVTVQRLAGHSSPAITAPYDRRGDRVLRDAVDRLRLPQPASGAPPA